MLKRFAPMMGAFAIAMGLLAGCQDAPTTSPTGDTYTIQNDEAYKAFELGTTPLNDFSEIPTVDDAIEAWVLTPPPPPRDSLRRDSTGRPPLPPPPPPRDSLRRDSTGRPPLPPPPPQRDTTHRPDLGGRLQPINYERVIRQLELTPDQDSLVRLCFADYRQCTQDAAETYRGNRQAVFQRYQEALQELHRKLAAGDITRLEARVLLERLNMTYRQEVAQLEAGYRRALAQCREEFESCVASHLTREQLAIWNRLLGR